MANAGPATAPDHWTEAVLDQSAYQLRVEPAVSMAVARHRESLLATTRRAKIMYETRLPASVYFPREDVRAALTKRQDLRTFCPFKGTANYWDVAIGDRTIEAGAWSYENALPEAADIAGLLGFSAEAATEITIGGGPVPSVSYGSVGGPTVDWMLREAWQCRSPEALIKAFADRLGADGVAVYRIAVLIFSLHPQLFGSRYVWERGKAEVDVSGAEYELLTKPAFTNSPVNHVVKGLGGVRQRLTDKVWEFSFPVLDDLVARGATDYVAMPLYFSDGQVNVVTLASDHPKGFTTANLGLIFEISPILSRYLEVFTLKSNARTLLRTYLGLRTADRVLGGEIRRGGGMAIKAAILICDLRHSTRLSSELDRETYLGLLNSFLEAATCAIQDQQGEVLKFMGDAVLAAFNASGERDDDCRSAVEAARTALAAIAGIQVPGSDETADCAIGIAYGDVTYGNIGAVDRLDFTVIGEATNLAARLCDLGKTLNRRIVLAGDLAEVLTECFEPMGEHRLRNVADPVSVCAVRE